MNVTMVGTWLVTAALGRGWTTWSQTWPSSCCCAAPRKATSARLAVSDPVPNVRLDPFRRLYAEVGLQVPATPRMTVHPNQPTPIVGEGLQRCCLREAHRVVLPPRQDSGERDRERD